MKKVRTLAVCLLAAAAVALPMTALAQQPGMVISFLDKSGDGKCDLNEYLGYHVSRIAEFDKDADGELNLGEFRESLQGRAKQNAAVVFKSSNAEGGRTLSQKEFLGYHAFVFKQYIDLDHDGFMSQEEWQKVMSSL